VSTILRSTPVDETSEHVTHGGGASTASMATVITPTMGWRAESQCDTACLQRRITANEVTVGAGVSAVGHALVGADPPADS